jgi:hypothetical protein
MAGIHVLSFDGKDVDGRNKSGHDEVEQSLPIALPVRLPFVV